MRAVVKCVGNITNSWAPSWLVNVMVGNCFLKGVKIYCSFESQARIHKVE
jgi:hypothetical protein